MAEEEQKENKKKNTKKGNLTSIPRTASSFFLVSGLTLFVTLWAFWDDEYTRRGYKVYQDQFFKEQYAVAEANWKKINTEIEEAENQIRQSLAQSEEQIGCLGFL